MNQYLTNASTASATVIETHIDAADTLRALCVDGALVAAARHQHAQILRLRQLHVDRVAVVPARPARRVRRDVDCGLLQLRILLPAAIGPR